MGHIQVTQPAGAAASHAHAESDVTGLTSDLSGKASTSHASAHAAGGSDALAVAEEFEILGCSKAYSNVNASSFTAVTSSFCGAHRSSTGAAANDEVVHLLPQPLRGGTYTLALLYVSSTNRGIVTISVSPDNSTWTDLGTVDEYNGSTVAFNRTEVAGVTVPAGARFLRLKVLSKNGSSTGYVLSESAVMGVRTGA